MLVVDQNAASRKSLSDLTSFWNMDSDDVDSGTSALEKLRAAAGDGKPYDMAIVSLGPPVREASSSSAPPRRTRRCSTVS